MPANKTRMIVADTETGGLDPKRNPVLTLSAIKTHDGDSFNIKINPPEHLEISEEALAVTGISLTDLRENGVSEGEAVKLFTEFLEQGNSVVAGCNFPFDMRFLREMYKRAGAPFPLPHRCVDLQTVAFIANEHGLIDLPHSKGGVLLLNLDVVSSAFGVSRVSELHDSLEDVKLTQTCIENGISKIKEGATRGKPPTSRLVMLDVETSGLDPDKHSILRISAMRADSGESLDVWVRPEPGSFGDKKALAVNGIDPDRVKKEGIPLRDALKSLQKFLSETGPHILSGCNVSFDVDFVEKGCKKYGMRPPFGGKRIDLQTAAYVAHECGWISLPDDNGKPDLSFNSISKACGFERGKGADRHPSDITLAHKCLSVCTGIVYGKHKDGSSDEPIGIPAVTKLPREAHPPKSKSTVGI
jgi:DNA polymerase III epsilon subunit-like protein